MKRFAKSSPPGESRVWFGPRIIPLVGLEWKGEERCMAIAKQHIEAIFSFEIVPLTKQVGFVAISPPGPVARD